MPVAFTHLVSQKMVKVSHRNIIANVLQYTTYENPHRTEEREVCLGLTPLSHSFCLLLVSHNSVYRGDGVIVYPGFDLLQLLQGIETYRMNRLWMVSSTDFGIHLLRTEQAGSILGPSNGHCYAKGATHLGTI